MAAVAPYPAVDSNPDADAQDRFFSLLRQERERIARLRSHLAACLNAETDEARAHERTSLRKIAPLQFRGIDDGLIAMEQPLDFDPHLAARFADAVTRLSNLWDDFKVEWDSAKDNEASAKRLKGMLDGLILEICYVTVPQRANENLSRMRPGSIMNFADEFKDEIPSPEGQKKLLAWMAKHPVELRGIVDKEQGKIMAASPQKWRRVMSWLMLAAVAALAILVAAFSESWLRLLGIPVPPGATNLYFIFTVLAAYVGAIAHVVVAALKQRRQLASRDDLAFTALGNLGLWVHVNEIYLVLYAIAVPACALAFTLMTGEVVLLSAFIVGYSIDSVLELMLSRFDRFASERTELVLQSASNAK